MRHLGTFSVLVALLLSPALADEPVRVYTNADLDALPALPPPADVDPEPDTGQAQESWAFVQAFIDRERARIDADRRWEIERRLGEARAEGIERESRRERYTLPLSYFGFGFYPGVRPPYRPGIGPRNARPLTTSQRFAQRHRQLQGGGRIVPIHARPNRTPASIRTGETR